MKSSEKNQLYVLAIEDEPSWRIRLSDIFNAYGQCRISFLGSFEEAEEFLSSADLEIFDAVVVDVRLREQIYDQGGLALLDVLKQRQPGMPVLVLTAYAYDYPGLRETTNRYSRVFTYDKGILLQNSDKILDLLFLEAPAQIGDQESSSSFWPRPNEIRQERARGAKRQGNRSSRRSLEGELSHMNFKETRKNDLGANINRQYKLLHEYETRRDLSDRPKEIELFIREIKSITRSLEEYIEQYNQICLDDGEPLPSGISAIWDELRGLKEGQQLIIKKQDETLEAINHSRDEIVMRIEKDHRNLAYALLSMLNEQETRITEAIVEGIDQNRLTDNEITEALGAIKKGYEELQSKALTLPNFNNASEEVKKLPHVWNSPDVSTGGKLKLSIPLIPAILSYEAELSVSVKQSLSALWGRFFKGKQILI